MALVLGFNGKLYYNTSGLTGGTWVLASNVRDLKISLEKGESDVTTRANGGYEAVKGALKKLSIELEMIWETTDAGFIALRAAYMNRTVIGITALDGLIATTGSQGPRAGCHVVKFSRVEDLGEVLKVQVTLKPTYHGTAPSWYIVPAP